MATIEIPMPEPPTFGSVLLAMAALAIAAFFFYGLGFKWPRLTYVTERPRTQWGRLSHARKSVVVGKGRTGRPPAREHRCFLPGSVSIGALHGGRLAFQRLADYYDAVVDDSTVEGAQKELRNLLAQENPDFNKLQSAIARLEMGRKEEKAVGILSDALMEVRKEKRPLEAYEIEMLLAEMLIYKGEFERALKLDCLSDDWITFDARRPLFKAIIMLLSAHPDQEAYEHWEQFRNIQKQFQWPPIIQENLPFELVPNFPTFRTLVKLLKKNKTITPQ